VRRMHLWSGDLPAQAIDQYIDEMAPRLLIPHHPNFDAELGKLLTSLRHRLRLFAFPMRISATTKFCRWSALRPPDSRAKNVRACRECGSKKRVVMPPFHR